MGKTHITLLLALLLSSPMYGAQVWARGPTKEIPDVQVRYSLPQKILSAPYRFAGEIVPLERREVRSKIRLQLNFLLMDARSVVTDWLVRKGRYTWIFEEIFAKQGIPQDFSLLAPILSGLNARYSPRDAGVGCWALKRLCTSSEGVAMSRDSWHDDRQDIDLSTRCFAARIKAIRKDLGTRSWITAAAAYLWSPEEMKQRIANWQTDLIWDLHLPQETEQQVYRWIALGILDAQSKSFGLIFKPAKPITFDQVSGLVLKKDLTVSTIARATGVSSRQILELNPRIKIAAGKLPAKIKGRRLKHTLAAPRGKGWKLVNHLKKNDYLSRRKPERTRR